MSKMYHIFKENNNVIGYFWAVTILRKRLQRKQLQQGGPDVFQLLQKESKVFPGQPRHLSHICILMPGSSLFSLGLPRVLSNWTCPPGDILRKCPNHLNWLY